MPHTIYRKDYRPTDFSISSVYLTVELGEHGTQVTSELAITRREHADQQAALILNGIELSLQSIELNGNPLSADQYECSEEYLTIPNVPNQFELKTTVTIHPETNTALEGIYQSGGKMFASQCEAEGFRKITYYLDRPDVLAEFTVKIIGDKTQYPVMLSNGNCIESGHLNNNQHYAIWHDPTIKPCYLFALVAGDLAVIKDTFITCSGRKIDLAVYAYQQDIDQCHHAMHALKLAMKWDEERFGREYDLDQYMIVAVPDFNSGAMENKGLNIFNTKYVLVDQKTGTDNDFELVAAVVAHEYFHNWTGNRVTCRDWFQLSLKEGLTVFRDQEFTSDHNARAVKRIEDVKRMRSAQFAEDASPMAHPIRPDSYIEMRNFYTLTVYEKGAEVIRMQHTLLGEQGFRGGMDLYFDRHDGQAVTCDDFVNAMADANHKDLSDFKKWYGQSGTPVLTFSAKYDAAAKQYHLTIQQETKPTLDQKTKVALHIPVQVGLLDSSGKEIAHQLLELKQDQQTFVFDNITEKPVPSLLRNFSAPVKIKFDYTTEDLLHLFAHDTDNFNRWDAGQTIATQCILNNQQLPKTFIKALQQSLLNKKLDKAYISELVTMPAKATLAELTDPLDVDALLASHQQVLKQLADELKDTWTCVYHQFKAQPYLLDHTSVAKRALKNTALAYLMQSQDQSLGEALALAQFKSADNMTDELAAFCALLQSNNSNIRNDAIDQFYQKWQGNALVMDKWFTQQALMPHANTLDHVKSLTQHPAFNIRNPNKVYALLGAFGKNFAIFHQADGTGYEFLAEMILKVDAINGQVAARMVRPLMNWRQLKGDRQNLMKAQLEGLYQAKLSNDVFEIVEKSLGNQ